MLNREARGEAIDTPCAPLDGDDPPALSVLSLLDLPHSGAYDVKSVEKGSWIGRGLF